MTEIYESNIIKVSLNLSFSFFFISFLLRRNKINFNSISEKKCSQLFFIKKKNTFHAKYDINSRIFILLPPPNRNSSFWKINQIIFYFRRKFSVEGSGLRNVARNEIYIFFERLTKNDLKITKYFMLFYVEFIIKKLSCASRWNKQEKNN